MHDPDTPTPRVARRQGATLLGLAATAAFLLGACTGGASALPSVDLPTQDPNATQLEACVDAGTKAVLDQLTAEGADIPTILETNSDLLIAGLQTFQPADEATMTWRDDFIAALEDGDMAAAQVQVEALISGGVALSAC